MKSPYSLYPIYVNLSNCVSLVDSRVFLWLKCWETDVWWGSCGSAQARSTVHTLGRTLPIMTCIASVSLQPASGYSTSILFPSIELAWIMYSEQLLQHLRPFSCITSRKERLSSRNFPVSTILPLLDYFVCGAVRFAKSNLYVTSIFFFLTSRNEAIREFWDKASIIFPLVYVLQNTHRLFPILLWGQNKF